MHKTSLRTQLSLIEAKMETDLSTELSNAVEKNDLNKIIDLISKGANVNAYDKNNKLPLQIAIKNECIEIIEKLIYEGANINVKIHDEEKDKTLLEYAMKESNANVVTLLVEKGATTILDDHNGEGTVLHHAAKNGILELVKSMINKGINVNVRTSDGLTPLHVAANHQRLEIVKYLCEMGADVNARNCRKSTPLFHAINKSNISLEIVKFLIDNDAEINVENDFYYTPLQLSLYEKRFDVAKLLIERGADINAIYQNTHYARRGLGGTLLHWAARRYNSDDIINFLIENGANINATERDGRTPLCLYAKHNHNLEMAKFFVEHGADLNNRGGGSPFYWACYIHNLSLQILLIELGLDVNAPADPYDLMKTSLHIANDLSVVELLIDKGANVNITDKEGNTPLHFARRLSIVKCLVENGAEINIKNHEGRTPLHITYDFLVAQYLVQKGADIHARDNKGYTPLHLATNVYTAEYLIEQGADINAVTIDGKTVLHGIAEFDTCLDARHADVPNIVRLFVEKGINIDVTDNNGDTALHLCSRVSGYETLYRLLEQGANISATNNENNKPEDNGYGIYSYTMKFIKKLAADLREGRKTKNVEEIIFRGINAYNVRIDNRKSNILHLIVQKCNPSMIRSIFLKLKYRNSGLSCILFKNNFINARDIDNWIPLHYAAQRGDSDIVTCLLQNGSMYNAETVNCETPLTLTTDDCTTSILKSTEQMFQEINLGNYAEVVNCINEQKAVVNAKDKDGNSPLHLAIHHGRMDIIELLLDHGAEIIQVNEEGITPLHLACSKDSKDIAENLLTFENVAYKNKMKRELLLNLLQSFVNLQAKDGTTALHIAAKHNHIEIVKLLLSSGASYNIKNKEGKCPVDLSTDTDIITLLEFVQELFNDATYGKPELINKLETLNYNEFEMVTSVRTKQRHKLEDILKYNEYESILSDLSKIQASKKRSVKLVTLPIEESDEIDLGFGLFD